MNAKHKKELNNNRNYVIPKIDSEGLSLKIQNRITNELIKLEDRLEKQLVYILRRVALENMNEDWIKADNVDKESLYSFFLTQVQQEINYCLQQEAKLGSCSKSLDDLNVEWNRLKELEEEQGDFLDNQKCLVI